MDNMKRMLCIKQSCPSANKKKNSFPQELIMSSEDMFVRRKRVFFHFGGEGGIPRRLTMFVCFSVVAVAPPQGSNPSY